MAVENERKYILKPNCEKALLPYLRKLDLPREIVQIYVTTNDHLPPLRLRRETVSYKAKTGEMNTIVNYRFAFKITFQNWPEQTTEIEQDVNQKEFDRFKSIADVMLLKTRYKHPVYLKNTGLKDRWDIDFFRDADTGKTYFAYAECEMPDGATSPCCGIPKWLQPHIVFCGEHKDNQTFSSFNLADKDRAKELYDIAVSRGNCARKFKGE